VKLWQAMFDGDLWAVAILLARSLAPLVKARASG
jgi:hypothetical protein